MFRLFRTRWGLYRWSRIIISWVRILYSKVYCSSHLLRPSLAPSPLLLVQHFAKVAIYSIYIYFTTENWKMEGISASFVFAFILRSLSVVSNVNDFSLFFYQHDIYRSGQRASYSDL